MKIRRKPKTARIIFLDKADILKRLMKLIN